MSDVGSGDNDDDQQNKRPTPLPWKNNLAAFACLCLVMTLYYLIEYLQVCMADT
jgi:hypothetical protein